MPTTFPIAVALENLQIDSEREATFDRFCIHSHLYMPSLKYLSTE